MKVKAEFLLLLLLLLLPFPPSAAAAATDVALVLRARMTAEVAAARAPVAEGIRALVFPSLERASGNAESSAACFGERRLFLSGVFFSVSLRRFLNG